MGKVVIALDSSGEILATLNLFITDTVETLRKKINTSLSVWSFEYFLFINNIEMKDINRTIGEYGIDDTNHLILLRPGLHLPIVNPLKKLRKKKCHHRYILEME